jgi:hypothetical protein
MPWKTFSFPSILDPYVFAARVFGFANDTPPRGFCWGIQNRAQQGQYHKIDAFCMGNSNRPTAKPLKSINFFSPFLHYLLPGTLRRPKDSAWAKSSISQTSDVMLSAFPRTKPQGRILLDQWVLAHISSGGFVAADGLFFHIWFCVCFRYGNSLGERDVSKNWRSSSDMRMCWCREKRRDVRKAPITWRPNGEFPKLA